jgi:hypothetical protein
LTELENGAALTKGSGWSDKPRPKRNGFKGMLPSTWLNRELRLEYRGADGNAQNTSGVLLDTYPAGPVLNVLGAKTLIGWDRLVLIELLSD